MNRDNYGSNPEFDEDIVEEYRRASARGFDAPPAASLRETSREEQFRWPAFNDLENPETPAEDAFDETPQAGERREEFYRDPEPAGQDFWGAPEPKDLGEEKFEEYADDTQIIDVQPQQRESAEDLKRRREEFYDAEEDDTVLDDYDPRDTIALERSELNEFVSHPRAPQTLDDDTVFVGVGSVPGWALDIFGGDVFVIPGENVIIGRNPKAFQGTKQLLIEDLGRTLSKSHARLFFEDGDWFLEDLGSTNGTAILTGGDLDGSSERVLNPGERGRVVDRFRIGTLHVRIRRLVEQ